MHIIAHIQPINDDGHLIRLSGSRSTVAELKQKWIRLALEWKVDGTFGSVKLVGPADPCFPYLHVFQKIGRY